MAKHGYTCKCGWQLIRNGLTRRDYAKAKKVHAMECNHLYTELRATQSIMVSGVREASIAESQ